jgi:hypothetical protein
MASEETPIPRKRPQYVAPENATPDTPIWRICLKDKEVPFVFEGRERTIKWGKPLRFETFEEFQAFAEFIEEHPDFVLTSAPEQDPLETGTIEALGNFVTYTTKGIGVPEPYTHVAPLRNIHSRLWVSQLPWEPLPPEYRTWIKEPLSPEEMSSGRSQAILTTKSVSRRYWAIQANPNVYDVQRAINEQEEDTWRVDESSVKIGDRLIVWKAKGDETTSGIIGLAEVIANPTVCKPIHMQYFRRSYTDNELLKKRALIRFVQSDIFPIWKESLPPDLSDLSVAKGVQGNVFKVSDSQWAALMEAVGGWPRNENKAVSLKLQRIDAWDYPLNTILYGPPGTGKTFSTISRAVEIIDGLEPGTAENAKERWEELREAGRIEFVTFHQSYSYEDFVEGIRPVMDDTGEGTPRYECAAGIFKEAALQALFSLLEPIPVAPGKRGPLPFSELWSELLERIAEEPGKVYPGLTSASRYTIEITPQRNLRGNNVANAEFRSYYNAGRGIMEEVFTALRHKEAVSTSEVKTAMGRDAHQPFLATVFRLLKEVEGKLSQDPTRMLPSNPVLPEAKEVVASFLAKGEASGYRVKPDRSTWPRHVLVVDEINRGNISKIFGELITLLEDDKRFPGDNALMVTLPYSRSRFVVSANLYLLGTMNTADKSIALVDVALRRRFEFEELMPDFSVCPGLDDEMRTVLKGLNQRIVLRKDRDHQIGHAFFMRVQTPDDFNRVFEKKIIPLLQEYFYGDWDALRFVLGEEKEQGGSFVIEIEGAQTIRGARNRWQWYWDAGYTLDALETLKRNYKIGTSES